MATTTSTRCSVRFASSAIARRLVTTGVVVGLLAVFVRGERARACGGGDWSGIEEQTTFDPQIVGAWDGLAYNPYDGAYGGACDDCLKRSMLGDWTAHLTGVGSAEWEKVLLTADDAALAALRARAAGKGRAPKGFETSSLWKAPKDRMIAALDFVRLAREVEPFASFELYTPDGDQRTAQPPPRTLVDRARKGMTAAAGRKDAFLAQRYAFQALRIAFYQRDWPAVVAFFDRNPGVFGGPSQDLAWQARHYVAGALKREGQKGRANLELARIATRYKPLAGLAVLEFDPTEEADWRASLRLARTVREKTELWQLVGIKKDALVAIQEILRLDPRSDLVGLLLVRELEIAESRVQSRWGEKIDPKDLAAQRKAYTTIEQIALGQIARNGDRPWLMELIAGHVAAKRGDLATARSRLSRAMASQPGDVRVASQARASLALALAASWRLGDGASETELAIAMAAVGPKFARRDAVRGEVRAKLARVYLAAGKLADAEFLKPGTVDPWDNEQGRPVNKRPHWEQRSFVQDMIARGNRRATPFDRFVVDGSFTHDSLQLELALRLVFEGDFAGAKAALPKSKSKRLGTDPFVMHIKDCHDCDHEKYARSQWDHASLIARLVELDTKVKQGGEAGADAALQIGNVLYNLSHWGNARIVSEETHQSTHDATPAIRWYKRAFDLTRNRELAVKAAYYAAKAELGTAMWEASRIPNGNDALPIPRVWFPVIKRYSNTRYYKSLLAECGHFAAWVR